MKAADDFGGGVTLLVTVPVDVGDRCEAALRRALVDRPHYIRRTAGREGEAAIEIALDDCDGGKLEAVFRSLRAADAPPSTMIEIEAAKASTELRLDEAGGA